MEKQKVAEKEAETQKKIALSEAEKNAQVSKILMEQKLMEKDSSKRQEQIDNDMYLAREKAVADANYYRHGWQYHILFRSILLMHASCFLPPTNRIWFGLSRILKEAEANRLKLTPEYLELRFIESIANNSKIFFGEKVLARNCYVLFFPCVSSSHGLSCELPFRRFLT
jgi:erlin